MLPGCDCFSRSSTGERSSVTPNTCTALTDVDNGYALSLNLAICLGPDLRDLLTQIGRVLPNYHGNDAWMLPIPATFVVGQDGLIKARFVDPDFRRRMDIDELIAALARSG